MNSPGFEGSTDELGDSVGGHVNATVHNAQSTSIASLALRGRAATAVVEGSMIGSCTHEDF